MFKKQRLFVFFIGIIFYQILFWKMSPGVNFAIFTLFIVLAANYLEKRWIKWLKEPKSRVEILLVALSVATAWHAAVWTIFVLIFIWGIWLGFRYFPDWKSIHFAGFQALMAMTCIPENLKEEITFSGKATKRRAIIRWLTISVVPIAVFFIFFSIYFEANPAFRSVTTGALSLFDNFFNNILKDINILWFIFILWGAFILLWSFFGRNTFWLIKKEHAEKDTIERTRKRAFVEQMLTHYTGLHQKLKDEFQAGMMLIVLVNSLLLLVNLLDLHLLWHDYGVLTASELSEMVHSGTYLLIFSILLSIGILLFIFRGNQNFFPKRKYLQLAAYVWIAQSILLTFSVAVRNYYYIYHYGLAYKRIGVVFFLILVLVGLITLWIKIKNQKSQFYMMRTNGWSVVFVLAFSALFNWDLTIANYNLKYSKADVDISYLLSMSDKVLALLEENKYRIKPTTPYKSNRYSNASSALEQFELRKKKFLEKKFTWQEWNYADAKAQKALRNAKKQHNIN